MKIPSTGLAILEQFDVEKYNACEDWNAKKWLIALSQRVYIQNFLHLHKGGITKGPMPEKLLLKNADLFLKLAEARIEDPIPTRETSASIPRLCSPSVISDFMLTDLYSILNITENAKKNGLQELKGLRLKDVEKAIGLPLNTFYLAIDLNASDAVILEKFDNWLKRARNESGIEPKHSGKRFNESDFKSWHFGKLLPYLDLVSWAKLSGYALSEREIGEKLFPTSDDNDADLRIKMRAIDKKALRLISKEYVTTLTIQCQLY